MVNFCKIVRGNGKEIYVNADTVAYVEPVESNAGGLRVQSQIHFIGDTSVDSAASAVETAKDLNDGIWPQEWKMSAAPRCDQCRFYGVEYEGSGWHECNLTECDGGQPVIAASRAHAKDGEDYYAVLHVLPDFGCVQFVAKDGLRNNA